MSVSQGLLHPVYTPLEREQAALVLIDLHIGPLSIIQTIAPSQLRRNVALLTRIARLYELPIVLTGAKMPPPGGTFLPEVKDFLPDHHIIERTTTNAWNTPEFVTAIEQTGRQQLVIAGVALEIGVMFPALSAVAAGYDVSVVVDATGTTDARIETGALLRLAQAGVSLVSCASIGMELQKNLSEAPGHELMALLGGALAPGSSPFSW